MKKQIPIEQAHRLLGPGPAVLVTALARGRHSIMPAAWVTPVNMRPPMIAIAINQAHFTAELIQRSEQFGLSIPSVELLKQVRYCGSVSGRDADKWVQTGLHQAEPHQIDTPLVEECLAHIECAVAQAIDLPDHTVFIGEVLYAAVEEGIFEERWLLEGKEAKPLHHLGGSFYALLEESIEAPAPEDT